VKKFLEPLLYINVFCLTIKKMPQKKQASMLAQWDRIMKGEEAPPKGGNKKRNLSQRSLLSKRDRTSSYTEEDDRGGKRRVPSSELQKKNRPRGNQLSKSIGSDISDKIKKDLLSSKTGAARQKKLSKAKSPPKVEFF
jgi:hypothetical protein